MQRPEFNNRRTDRHFYRIQSPCEADLSHPHIHSPCLSVRVFCSIESPVLSSVLFYRMFRLFPLCLFLVASCFTPLSPWLIRCCCCHTPLFDYCLFQSTLYNSPVDKYAKSISLTLFHPINSLLSATWFYSVCQNYEAKQSRV